MVRPDRASLASTAPLAELLTLLLRQFRRPLLAENVQITEADVHTIARDIANRQPLSEKAHTIRDGLIHVVSESEAVLAQWGLSFEQSLETGMDRMPGWETTAEFLEIANEKSNAELRIAAASALVAALGDLRYVSHLFYLAGREGDDIDEIVARRVLSFLSAIDANSPDWLEQVRAWAAKARTEGRGLRTE